MADSHALRLGENEFLLLSERIPAETLRKRLEDFIVADDVAVETCGGPVSAIALGGAGAAEALAELGPAPGRFVARDGAWILASAGDPRREVLAFGAPAAVEEIRARCRARGVVGVSAEEAELGRIEAGIAAVPADLGPGDLPNEGGLDAGAVSLAKGCYLGQEVMARLKNLGQVRRELRVVRGEGPPPAPGAPLWQGAVSVAELRSVASAGARWAALAMVTRARADRGSGLALAANGPAVVQWADHG